MSQPIEGLARDFSLPRGAVVRGKLVDRATAKPISGGCVFWDAPVGRDNLHCDRNLVQDSSIITAADDVGQFTLTVPAGPVRLQAFGPTQDYVPCPCSAWARSDSDDRPRWGLTPTPPDQYAHYCHAEALLELTSDARPVNVSLELRKGLVIEGEVCASDGQPVTEAVLLCSGRVSPLRNRWGQPLPVRNGRFVLPGCEEGTVCTVPVLDVKRQEGAIAKVSCSVDPSRRPRIQLEPCGEARVRVEWLDRPSAGRAAPAIHSGLLASGGAWREQPAGGSVPGMFLRLPKSYPASETPGAPVPVDYVEDCGIASIYMRDFRRMGTDGVLTLPCLIPGAEYVLYWTLNDQQHSRVFSVQPGEKRHLAQIKAFRGDQPPAASE